MSNQVFLALMFSIGRGIQLEIWNYNEVKELLISVSPLVLISESPIVNGTRTIESPRKSEVGNWMILIHLHEMIVLLQKRKEELWSVLL